jgi:ferritin-like metal-binding protein YciE
MELANLKELFVHELKDIYSAENQIVAALPKVAQAVSHPELKQAFEEHLEQTRGQVARLEQIFEMLGQKPTGVTCKGMKGLLAEGEEMLKHDAEPSVKDAGLIAAQQKVEHYEIAGYGTVVTYAKLIKHKEATKLLKETLNEEEQTDKKLSQIAEQVVNPDAAKA